MSDVECPCHPVSGICCVSVSYFSAAVEDRDNGKWWWRRWWWWWGSWEDGVIIREAGKSSRWRNGMQFSSLCTNLQAIFSSLSAYFSLIRLLSLPFCLLLGNQSPLIVALVGCETAAAVIMYIWKILFTDPQYLLVIILGICDQNFWAVFIL